MEPSFLIGIADWVALIYCVLLIGSGIWAFAGRLPADIKSKYSIRVTYMSQIPFAYQWRQAVNSEDLPAFERARVRQHAFFTVISALILLIIFYAYMNAIAMLHQCQSQGVGLR